MQHLSIDPTILSLCVALGIGLLIGVERERRKGDGATRGAAGVRTFALAALSGAIARLIGGEWLLIVACVGVALLATAAYLKDRSDDPGITTEVALILTLLLGGMAKDQPQIAAGLGVVVAVLLAARSPMHRFAGAVLSEAEVRDGLIFAAATFVVWPLLPSAPLGPFGAVNLHAVWLVVILVMGIGAAGYVLVRLIGARFGLPLTGLVSGFISSTATIGAMGARAARDPRMLSAATAGAVLSNVATIVQIGVVLTVVDARVTLSMLSPLAFAALMAAAYAAAFTLIAWRGAVVVETPNGGAFNLRDALGFAAFLCVVLIGSAALAHWFGDAGVIAGAALTGLVDVHAAAASVAALTAQGALPVDQAPTAILVALSTNTISKIAMAASSITGAVSSSSTVAATTSNSRLTMVRPMPWRNPSP